MKVKLHSHEYDLSFFSLCNSVTQILFFIFYFYFFRIFYIGVEVNNQNFWAFLKICNFAIQIHLMGHICYMLQYILRKFTYLYSISL